MEPINWHSFFFLLFALIACWFAIAVVISTNVVRMAFYLVISLGAVAGLFFLAGAEFLGAVQLMLYVGGTLVLLAFGVMLTARGPFVSMQISAGQWIIATFVGGSLLSVLLEVGFSVGAWHGPTAPGFPSSVEGSTDALGLGLLGVRVDQLEQDDRALVPLVPGMNGYLLVFEILSVHLLVVLIGAAYLARAKRRRAVPIRRPADRDTASETLPSASKPR